MEIKKYINKELIEKSIDLTNEIGAFELAWKYADAIAVLDILEQNKVIVSGGDVLNNQLSYTYDNWSYNEKDYIESIEYAKEYINNYFSKNGSKFYYVLVVRNEKKTY